MHTPTEAPPVSADESHAIMREALIRRAAVKLARIDDIRAAARLSQSGKTQREIAELLHVTQPVVHRLLRDADTLGVEPGTEEIILRAAVEGTSRDELVARLISSNHTFHAPCPSPGSKAGTWEQIIHAHNNGLLSNGEYERIRAAVQTPHTVDHPCDAHSFAARRPIAIIDDLASLHGPSAGIVNLPLNIDWSPKRTYDLNDEADRRVLYERVLREALRVDQLAELLNAGLLTRVWPHLWLPREVRARWEHRFPELAVDPEPGERR